MSVGSASRSAQASWSRFDMVLRRRLNSESIALGGLVLAALVCGAAIVALPVYVPLVSLLVPLVVASLVLGPQRLPWFVVFVLLVLAVVVPTQPDISIRTAVAVVIMFGLGFFVLVSSFRRSQLGVAGLQGESMLVDLRDRILRHGGIPDLPDSWYVARELRSAGGTPFAGDFVVAARSDDRLDVVVVDVSGKGAGAGTRALLLSGAFGGLLSALPPDQFLPEANKFLLRQNWGEGFATAIHLSLHLDSGRFELRTAGHPPAALREAGSGRWRVVETEGPILGLIPDWTYESVGGVMRPGDALLLYTDGMVEVPDRDISLGIDKMLGQAEQLLRGEFADGARRLIETIGSHHDDRALVLVHRK